MNAGYQGISALGKPNANLLALNRENMNNQWAEDTAGQYEQDWAQAGTRAAGMLGDVAGLENARKIARLGATSGTLNTTISKPKWWEILLGQAGQGAQAAATYGAA
jgi:hypothetical protein